MHIYIYTYKIVLLRERVHSLSRKPSNPGRGGAENCTVPRTFDRKPKQVYPPFLFIFQIIRRKLPSDIYIEINGRSKKGLTALHSAILQRKKKYIYIHVYFFPKYIPSVTQNSLHPNFRATRIRFRELQTPTYAIDKSTGSSCENHVFRGTVRNAINRRLGSMLSRTN